MLSCSLHAQYDVPHGHKTLLRITVQNSGNTFGMFDLKIQSLNTVNSNKVRERRHAARQHAAALAHAGDADEVRAEVPAALRLLALAVEDGGHVSVEGEDVGVGLVRVRQVPGVEVIGELRPRLQPERAVVHRVDLVREALLV